MLYTYNNVACQTIGAFSLSGVRGPNDKNSTKDLGNVEAISGDKFASDYASRTACVGLLLLTIVYYDEKETHEGINLERIELICRGDTR